MPPATRTLILLNSLVFLAQLASPDMLFGSFALWPVGDYYSKELRTEVGFEPWQLVSYAFLHGNLLHLLLNMLALFMFGREVEAALGSRRFVSMYTASVLTAGIVQLIVVSVPTEAGPFPTVGASGGAFGVLLAFAMVFPNRIVTLLFPPIPMRAWVFVTIYGLIELVQGVTGTAAGIAHLAHLGGMLGAYLVLRRR
jgi:membrane associated rhomboid family serine protease